MVKLVDTLVSGASWRKPLGVQVPFRAQELKFVIEMENYSDENIFIKDIYLNVEFLNRLFIEHSEIVNGGKIKFVMSLQPNNAGSSDEFVLTYSLND